MTGRRFPLLALSIAAIVASALGVALRSPDVGLAVASAAAAAAFALLATVWLLAWRRAAKLARALDELSVAARRLSGGELDEPLGPPADRRVAALSTAVEHLRTSLLEHRDAVEQHRAVMTEVVTSLGEGVIAVDRDRRVAVANRRVVELFGAVGELTGRSVLEVVRKTSVANALESALRGEAAVDRLVVGSGGGERQIELRAFPVEASADIAAVVLFIDVTQIERLQRIRKDFLDDFSHEIRTPLTGLRSAVDILQQGSLSRDAEQQMLAVVGRQLARIERLVADLSELNQIESGVLVLDRRAVGLRELLRELCEDVEQRSGAVRFTVGGAEVIATVDAARVQQIFANIFDNACKHAGRGTVRVELSRRDDQAVVTVSDEGPGIPPHELDRIFHRFYRVDRSRSEPGTGLGLAISKHLVMLHGGSIRALDNRQGGATIEVRLPLEPPVSRAG